MQRAQQTVTEFDDAAAAEACREALDLLHAGQGDPQAVIVRVLSARPDFVAAHCLRAAGLVMACRDDALPALGETLRTARLHLARAGERERAHLAAAQAWLDKDMKRSLRLYGEIAERDPKDTLALRVAQFGDLQWGRTDLLRERIAADGGSRAQCDLLHLTWLEAALRSHQSALARQLLRERIASRPQSPYNESLRERIALALHNGDTAAITGCTPDTSAVQTHCHAVTPLRQSGAGPARGPMARLSARRGLVTAISKGA